MDVQVWERPSTEYGREIPARLMSAKRSISPRPLHIDQFSSGHPPSRVILLTDYSTEAHKSAACSNIRAGWKNRFDAVHKGNARFLEDLLWVALHFSESSISVMNNNQHLSTIHRHNLYLLLFAVTSWDVLLYVQCIINMQIKGRCFTIYF